MCLSIPLLSCVLSVSVKENSDKKEEEQQQQHLKKYSENIDVFGYMEEVNTTILLNCRAYKNYKRYNDSMQKISSSPGLSQRLSL